MSNIDFVNSGSYFTELFIVVRGMITLPDFGGSFLITGCTFGLIDTNDLGSTAPDFFGGGSGTGFAPFCTGSGFATGLGRGFFAKIFGAPTMGLDGFLATGLGADFFTVFFATGLGADFSRFSLPPVFWQQLS